MGGSEHAPLHFKRSLAQQLRLGMLPLASEGAGEIGCTREDRLRPSVVLQAVHWHYKLRSHARRLGKPSLQKDEPLLPFLRLCRNTRRAWLHAEKPHAAAQRAMVVPIP
jgi:hypothetical protein